MQFSTLILSVLAHFSISSITISSAASGESSESKESIDWQCGSDEFSKYISENQIDLDCPNLKVKINSCCLRHDTCYDNQEGKKHCDDVFCKCLDDMTAPSAICNKEDSPLFCGMVREFGADAYLRSGNSTNTTIEKNTNNSTSTLIEKSKTDTTTHSTHDYDYESSVKHEDHRSPPRSPPSKTSASHVY